MADEGGSAFARDPMMQKWWTLPMALAWGLWKAPEMVDWAWPAKARDYFDGTAPSISTVMWHFRYDESRHGDHLERWNTGQRRNPEDQVRRALDCLVDALENERIRADGTEPGTGSRRAIGSEDWRKAELGSLHFNSDLPEHDALYVKRSHTPILLGVRVLREDVLREFGAAPVTEAREAELVEEAIPAQVEPAVVPGIVASGTLAENIGDTKRGSRPRITGDKLAVMMKHPPVAGTINSDDFLSEAQRRPRRGARTVRDGARQEGCGTPYEAELAPRKSCRVIP